MRRSISIIKQRYNGNYCLKVYDARTIMRKEERIVSFIIYDLPLAILWHCSRQHVLLLRFYKFIAIWSKSFFPCFFFLKQKKNLFSLRYKMHAFRFLFSNHAIHFSERRRRRRRKNWLRRAIVHRNNIYLDCFDIILDDFLWGYTSLCIFSLYKIGILCCL